MSALKRVTHQSARMGQTFLLQEMDGRTFMAHRKRAERDSAAGEDRHPALLIIAHVVLEDGQFAYSEADVESIMAWPWVVLEEMASACARLSGLLPETTDPGN